MCPKPRNWVENGLAERSSKMLCKKNVKKGHKPIPAKWLKMFWLDKKKTITWQKINRNG